jgi:hypothetical protein
MGLPGASSARHIVAADAQRFLFDDADSNRDGTVDLHEFCRFVFRHGLTFGGREPLDVFVFGGPSCETTYEALDYAQFRRRLVLLDADKAWAWGSSILHPDPGAQDEIVASATAFV